MTDTATPATWDHLLRQSGMFGFLGLPANAVKILKGTFVLVTARNEVLLTQLGLDQYHIYMAENSRISIAGLNSGNVEYVAGSIAEALARGP
jgi:aspartate aminotransferase